MIEHRFIACGTCGARHPDQRCAGCLHDFGYGPPKGRPITQSAENEESAAETVTWRAEWPDTEGTWWFYGWPFGNKDRKPEFVLLSVCKTRDGGLVIVGNSHFWYKQEGAVGKFCVAQLPEIPTP